MLQFLSRFVFELLLFRRRVKGKIDLHVLIYKEEGFWVAHCLELDIVGGGNLPKNALKEMYELVEDHIAFCFDNKIENTLFKPAPPEYWNMWLKSEPYYPSHLIKPLSDKIESIKCALVKENELVVSGAK